MASYFERQEDRVNDRGWYSMEVPNDVTLERFHKFRPPKFSGAGGEESAERWIDTINDIYKVLQYSDDRKVAFVEFQLEGPTKNWWRIIEDKWKQTNQQPTWDEFLMEFRKKYREKREEEFMYLKQRTLTVSEY